MEEEDTTPDEEEKTDIVLEAYPSYERVKKEILDRRSMINESLAAFALERSSADNPHPRKWSREATNHFKTFQVGLLSLYEYVKPNLKNSNKYKDYGDLEKLDNCFLNLTEANKIIPPKEWLRLNGLMTEFVYRLGITKLEQDIKAKEREGLVWER